MDCQIDDKEKKTSQANKYWSSMLDWAFFHMDISSAIEREENENKTEKKWRNKLKASMYFVYYVVFIFFRMECLSTNSIKYTIFLVYTHI